MTENMKVVIACDSFKGCLTSREAGEAAAEGVRLAMPEAETIVVPVADGGEGTVEAIADALGGRIVNVSVDGPLGAPTEAYYAISRETAVIEVAAACGLTLVDESGRNPMIATTYGVGQLIRDAILSGCRRFLIGLGGSATNDAGVGMLRALGWRFFDSDGLEIGRYAGEVGRISRIDTSMVMPELAECQFTVACDVKNPLVGPLGASHVFGPQKGATPAMADALDQALASFARLASDMYGKDLSSVPGAGAAGGLGFAFLTFLDGSLRPGIDMVLDTLRFDDHIADADLVITGEGRLDLQTLMGKTPAGILRKCRTKDIPIIAIGGSIAENATQALIARGFTAVFSIQAAPISLPEALRGDTAAANITRTVSQISRVLLLAHQNATS